MLLRLLDRKSFSSKCYDDWYFDFLVYLVNFEASGFKIYDLFESVRRGDIELGKCYQVLANKYILLESTLGAPHLALRKLSEIVSASELSRFLRDYSSVLVTSGDTKYFVESVLKREFAKYKAKIGEYQRNLDVLYESYLVGILVSLFFIVLPIWKFLPIVSLLMIYALGITGYFLAYRICTKLYYTMPEYVVVCDIVVSTLIALSMVVRVLPLIIPLIILALHAFTRTLVSTSVQLEQDSLRIVYDTYSQILIGRSVSTALTSSLSSSGLTEYRLLWFGLMLGIDPKSILGRIKLPVFTSKILYLLLATLPYSSAEGKHAVYVVEYVDEVLSTRKQVREKAKSYTIYSLIVLFLILAAYVMLSRIPLMTQLEKHTLATYSFVGFLLTLQPAVLIKDGGFTSSRSTLLLSFASLALYLLMIHLL